MGSTPSSLVAYDFNGDGRDDLATANSGSDSVSLLMGFYGGQFQTQNTHQEDSWSYPTSIVVGHFDEQSLPELAVSNQGTGDLLILPVHPDGTFGAKNLIPVGGTPAGLVAGDFNGDGRDELATTDYYSSTVSVVTLGSGDNGSSIGVTQQSVPYPTTLVTADFNSDGVADLATTDGVSGRVSLLIGAGDGTFFHAGVLPDVERSAPWWRMSPATGRRTWSASARRARSWSGRACRVLPASSTLP